MRGCTLWLSATLMVVVWQVNAEEFTKPEADLVEHTSGSPLARQFAAADLRDMRVDRLGEPNFKLPRPPKRVQRLLQQLRSHNANEREQAVRALIQVGGYPEVVIPEIISIMKRKGQEPHRDLQTYLGYSEMGRDRLIDAMLNPTCSGAARTKLAQTASHCYSRRLLSSEREQLVQSLQSGHEQIRAVSLYTLVDLDSRTEPGWFRLACEMLRSEDFGIRSLMVEILPHFSNHRTEVKRLLLKIYRTSENEEEKLSAVSGLTSLYQPNEYSEVHQLLQDPETRRVGLQILQHLYPVPTEAVPVVVSLLKSDDQYEQQIGNGCVMSCPHLVQAQIYKLVQDRRLSDAQRSVGFELIRIHWSDLKKTRELAMSLLDDDNETVALWSAVLLLSESTGSRSAESALDRKLIRKLIQGLSGEDTHLQMLTIDALKSFTGSVEFLFPDLLQMLDSPNSELRETSRELICYWDAASPAVLKKLEEIVEQSDSLAEVLAALQTLSCLGGPAQNFLISFLVDETNNADARAGLLDAIASASERSVFDEPGRAFQKLNGFIPALKTVTRQRDHRLVTKAREALHALQPKQFPPESPPPAKPSVAELIQELEEDTAAETLNELVLESLTELGGEAIPAIPAVVRHCETCGLRQAGLDFFVEMGLLSKPAVPMMLQLLRNELYLDGAAWVLKDHPLVGEEVLFEELRSLTAWPLYRPRIVGLINKLSLSGPDVVSFFLEELDDPDPYYRQQAVIALARCGRENPVVYQKLVALLKNDPDLQVKESVIDGLGELEIHPATSVQLLVDVLCDPALEPLYRPALMALANDNKKPHNSLAASRLVELLDPKSSRFWEQRAVLWALAALDEAALPAFPKVHRYLREFATDTNDPRLFSILEIMQNLEEAAKPALPEILKIATNKGSIFAIPAEEAAWAIDPVAAGEAGLEDTRKSDFGSDMLRQVKRFFYHQTRRVVKVHSSWTNWEFHTQAFITPLEPRLLEALNDNDPHVRGAAVLGLSRYGASPEKVIPAAIAFARETSEGPVFFEYYLKNAYVFAPSAFVDALLDPTTSADSRELFFQAIDDTKVLLSKDRVKLERSLHAETEQIRAFALWFLWRGSDRATKSARYLPVLQELLRNGSEETRVLLTTTLNPESAALQAEFKSVLFSLIASRNQSVVRRAARRLRKLLTAADVPRLQKLLDDPETRSGVVELLCPSYRAWAHKPLPASVPVLLALLESDDDNERKKAATALANADTAILRHLEQLLQNPETSPETLLAVLDTQIEAFQKDFSVNPEVLKPLFQHKNETVAIRAALAYLERLPSDGKSPLKLLPLLVKSIGSPETDLLHLHWARHYTGRSDSIHPELIQLLTSPDRHVRLTTLEVIQLLEANSPAILDALVEHLEKIDTPWRSERITCMDTLASLGFEGETRLVKYLQEEGRLRELLRDEGVKHWWELEDVFEQLEGQDTWSKLVPLLERFVQGKDRSSALQAIRLLYHYRPDKYRARFFHIILQRLKSRDADIQELALSMLYGLANRPEFELLLPQIASVIAQGRHHDLCFDLLTGTGKKAAPILPQIVAACEVCGVSEEALNFFVSLEELAGPALPLMKRQLRNVYLLEITGPSFYGLPMVSSSALFDELFKMAEEPIYFIPTIKYLTELPVASPKGAPYFLNQLDNPDGWVRYRALRYLTSHGTRNEQVHAKVITMLDRETHQQAKRWILMVLRDSKVKPAETVRFFLKVLNDPKHRQFHWEILFGMNMVHLAPYRDEAMSELVDMFEPDADVTSKQQGLLRVFADSKKTPPAVVPKLRTFLKVHSNHVDVYEALAILQNMAEHAKLALPEIVAIAIDGDHQYSSQAAKTAWTIDPDAAKAAGLPVPSSDEQ